MNDFIHSLIPFRGGKHQLRKFTKRIEEIERHEADFCSLTPQQVKELSLKWRTELSSLGDDLAAIQRAGEMSAQIFALARTAARQLAADSKSQWDMIHYDVQLLGGLAIGCGSIAEMATGEGKTLAATLPVYLYALCGRGVHVITVNEFLAARDAEWMGLLYERLGLTYGCLHSKQDDDQRREMYSRDITYGTASEFGFDYLRDNCFTTSRQQQVQRGHFFALIDEADSILIDEARTPLIISAPASSKKQDEGFQEWRPKVEALVDKQRALCSKLMAEVFELHKLAEPADEEEIGKNLYLVSKGCPLHPELARAKENPQLLRLLERTDLSFHRQDQREQVFQLTEALFFTVSERENVVNLSEQGRAYFETNGKDEFTVPDLATLLSELDALDISETEKTQRQQELENIAASRSAKIHQVSQLLRAYSLFEKDIDYLVKDGEVIILDKDRGLAMPGRRWSDGLHQAIEAKEEVAIQPETETTATISLQNYFRLYRKVGGMTGTAMTDAEEFSDIYGVEVIEIPSNKPCQRVDLDDRVYKTKREKFAAVVSEICSVHKTGQPILVGTASVTDSETVSRMLQKRRIPHSLLNAKNHSREAEIIARAGAQGAVTISTNMAGRGTDIKLDEQVIELGGLYVIGTERHESRRVDRQLRGRCSRQGDPGKSGFFISFEDDLLRRFGSMDRMVSILDKVGGHAEGCELSHPLLSKSVERAQRQVEKHHYEARKNVLKYDNVLNNQRLQFYTWKNTLLDAEEPIQWLHELFLEEGAGEDDEFASTLQQVEALNLVHLNPDEELRSALVYEFNRHWKHHLDELAFIREGIHLWAHAQKDPIWEYRRESGELYHQTCAATQQALLAVWRNFPRRLVAQEKQSG